MEGSRGVLERWEMPVAKGGASAVVAKQDELTKHTARMERGRTSVRCLLARPTMEPRGTGMGSVRLVEWVRVVVVPLLRALG